MIILNKNGNNYEASFFISPPSIYLDSWAWGDLSSNSDYRKRFLTFLETKGTVFFSYLNAAEISKNKGESLEKIRSFLTDIGKNWYPIESDPLKVIEREKQYVAGKNCPFLSESFFKEYYTYGGALSLSKIISFVQDKQGNSLLLQSDQAMEEAALFVNSKKEELLKKARLGQKICPFNTSFDSQHPTEFVYHSLLNLIFLKEKTLKFKKSDSCDFFHATVSFANSDMVLLDQRWADFTRKIKMIRTCYVYSEPQLNQFLQKFEQW